MTTNPTKKWTIGGWNRNVKPASHYPTIYAGRNTHVAVVSTKGLSESEIEGNCNLIASAEKLYDALELVCDTYGFDPSIDSSIWQTAFQALASARGETP